MINSSFVPEPDLELAPLLHTATKDISVTDTLPANAVPEFNVCKLVLQNCY